MTTVQFDLPNPLGQHLADAWGDLSRAAKEALAIESYRAGKISIGFLAQLLGFATRFDAEQSLGKRGVHWNYSIEDFDADCATLDRVLGKQP